MKRTLVCALLAVALVCALMADLALAKRLGGGSSFGSRPTYSKPYSPSTPSYAPSTRPTQPAPSVQPQTAQPTPPLAQPQGGLFSRMGWGLGGFVAGGLIGSMLFGGPGGWGGGGGFGLLDMLLVGLIVYFGFKLLRGRSNQPPQDASGPASPSGPSGPADTRSSADSAWDSLRSKPSEQAQPAQGAGGFGVASGSESVEQGPVVPEGFNVPEFLEGAKTVYARLQHSWERRDLNDIALFTTPEVLEEIRRQAAGDPSPSKTELLLVNARLLEFREESQDTVAAVLFDVLMREDAAEDRPKQVREVWHFCRPTGDVKANWRLEGIQQLEA